MFKFLTIALTIFCISGCSESSNWGVIDGDTIRHGENVIRLWGIDAPEINQRCLKEGGVEYKCGQDAKTALEVLILNKLLVCEHISKDRYGRDVARCKVDGMDLGGLMVSLGWAVDYGRYSDGYYQLEQYDAQKQGFGLWKGEFEKPSEHRKQKKEEQ